MCAQSHAVPVQRTSPRTRWPLPVASHPWDSAPETVSGPKKYSLYEFMVRIFLDKKYYSVPDWSEYYSEGPG
jgi:hypothetical protein